MAMKKIGFYCMCFSCYQVIIILLLQLWDIKMPLAVEIIPFWLIGNKKKLPHFCVHAIIAYLYSLNICEGCHFSVDIKSSSKFAGLALRP